ncbi:hypothetical protein FEM33_05145 [Dyadobacter flavalbus]|uniref:Uncharacterized protein n=1 Tax=Dyadobacter flavalbus TaxID=2579942 RepID=A0A5M8R2F1_9BACT|nr:hypothetical protein [Dyadobacter flavalbus]KAA6440913.1 hypothetical protein FEM33_05145 [Dyadobacter flavalbus]
MTQTATAIDKVHQINTINHLPGNRLQLQAGVDMEKLIGHAHLFGRYFDTREGFQIEPIGTMTLQADGRVTGYAHPNEGSWKPYIHGTVSSDKAFAFISAHNGFIPSSTWQQSLGSMPIGYFCDEPERLSKLCLVPHQVVSSQVRIIYLVASCYNFFKDGRTIPNILGQLYAEGIGPDRIKVVVNGCEQNENRMIEGVSFAFSTHNAWEYSAMYEAPLRWDFDYAMLIHDTNRINPGFRRKVEEFNGHLMWDHLPATPLARCLIGLYSRKFLQRLNPWLKSIDGIDKANGIIAEASGEILLHANSVLVMSDPESNGASRQAEWKEVVDVYNTGSPRVRRVFPAIGLHKFIHSGNTNPLGL